MKRDLEIIREILLRIEAFEPENLAQLQTLSPDDFGGTAPQNRHHVQLLSEAGFIQLVGKGAMDGSYHTSGLTMTGHDFLNSVRPQSIWEKTMERLSDAGSWTLELAADVAKQEAKRYLLGD